ncbi:MAG: group III truncated hemoglobin [Ferruginibacter sp.]
MDIKHDINSRADIELFLKVFYDSVKRDKTIGIIFTEIIKMDWEHHIPLIADFWETILLDNPVYKRNAMEIHYKLNKAFPLQKKHFEAWLTIFYLTLDEMYEGKNTELAKKRALSIASLMEHKLNDQKNIITSS